MTLTHFIVTSDSAVYSWQCAPHISDNLRRLILMLRLDTALAPLVSPSSTLKFRCATYYLLCRPNCCSRPRLTNIVCRRKVTPARYGGTSTLCLSTAARAWTGLCSTRTAHQTSSPLSLQVTPCCWSHAPVATSSVTGKQRIIRKRIAPFVTLQPPSQLAAHRQGGQVRPEVPTSDSGHQLQQHKICSDRHECCSLPVCCLPPSFIYPPTLQTDMTWLRLPPLHSRMRPPWTPAAVRPPPSNRVSRLNPCICCVTCSCRRADEVRAARCVGRAVERRQP
jgi:hypothetical protein